MGFNVTDKRLFWIYVGISFFLIFIIIAYLLYWFIKRSKPEHFSKIRHRSKRSLTKQAKRKKEEAKKSTGKSDDDETASIRSVIREHYKSEKDGHKSDKIGHKNEKEKSKDKNEKDKCEKDKNEKDKSEKDKSEKDKSEKDKSKDRISLSNKYQKDQEDNSEREKPEREKPEREKPEREKPTNKKSMAKESTSEQSTDFNIETKNKQELTAPAEFSIDQQQKYPKKLIFKVKPEKPLVLVEPNKFLKEAGITPEESNKDGKQMHGSSKMDAKSMLSKKMDSSVMAYHTTPIQLDIPEPDPPIPNSGIFNLTEGSNKNVQQSTLSVIRSEFVSDIQSAMRNQSSGTNQISNIQQSRLVSTLSDVDLSSSKKSEPKKR